MGFILEDRMSDNRPNGWYAGPNKKYHDMFNLTSDKTTAYIFENETDAQNKASYLNKGGWNFTVISAT